MLNCPSCSATLRPTARICIKCGHNLSDEERAGAGLANNPQEPPKNDVQNYSSDTGPIFEKPVVDIPSQTTVLRTESSISQQKIATSPHVKKFKFTIINITILGLSLAAAVAVLLSYLPKKSNTPEVAKISNSAPTVPGKPRESESVVSIPDQNSVINFSNIRRVNAPSASSELLTEMLVSCMNPIKLIEIKNQITALNLRDPRGDIKTARLLNERGLALFRQENYLEAAQFFSDAYSKDSGDIEINNNLGFAYLKAVRYPEAEKWLGQTLSIAPGRTSAWANLADLYANTGRMDSSISAFVVGFQFAENKDKALQFLKDVSASDPNPNLRAATQKALNVLGQP
jgi:hypothetical protein